MVSKLRSFVLALLGLAFVFVGVAFAVIDCPSPDVFARLVDALPILRTVASFAFALVAALVGAVILLPFAWRLRRARANVPVLAKSTNAEHVLHPLDDWRSPAQRLPVPQDDRFDADDAEAPGDWEEHGDGDNHRDHHDDRRRRKGERIDRHRAGSSR